MNKPALLIFLAFGAAFFATSPQGKATDDAISTREPSQDVTLNPDEAAKGMLGYYVGGFTDKKITVRLDKIIGNTLEGYSVVSGNERAFSGWYKPLPTGNVELLVKEPGDDPTDGVFHFQVEASKPMLTGSWTPNNRSWAPVQLVLEKRDFKYNPHTGKYPQSSLKLLKSDDVSNMSAAELRIMRNEMYARHGYSFKLKDMQQYFDQQDWYMPVSTDVTGDLTKLEQKNEAMIKRYEDYTATHYDVFGR